MHLLDSDTLSHLHAGNPRVADCLRNTVDSETGTTIVSKIEMVRARCEFVMKARSGTQLLKAQRWLLLSEQLLAKLLVVPFDDDAADQFGSLRRVRSLRKIGREDMLIASIDLANNATLVTRNLRHFTLIPNLRVVNWVDK